MKLTESIMNKLNEAEKGLTGYAKKYNLDLDKVVSDFATYLKEEYDQDTCTCLYATDSGDYSIDIYYYKNEEELKRVLNSLDDDYDYGMDLEDWKGPGYYIVDTFLGNHVYEGEKVTVKFIEDLFKICDIDNIETCVKVLAAGAPVEYLVGATDVLGQPDISDYDDMTVEEIIADGCAYWLGE